jgi:hypothetical protein
MDHDASGTKPDWKLKTPEEWHRYQHKKKRAKHRKARLTPDAGKRLRRNAVDQLARQHGTTSDRGVFTSTGTREHDIFRPEEHEPGVAQSVGDVRRDKTFCRGCQAEVEVRQVDGEWLTCDPDGTPHEESCPSPPPKPDDW